jgi:hypothetical protein
MGEATPNVIPVADDKENLEQHELKNFKARIFGGRTETTVTLPRFVPALPPLPPRALPPPSPGQAAGSPRPSGTPIAPAPTVAPAGQSEGDAGNRGGACAAPRSASSPAPIGKGGRSQTSSGPDWPKLIGEIKDALSAGPEKLQAVISAGLPKYQEGEPTYGVLVTNEGDVVLLQSAKRNPLYRNYVPSGHVEGKAALWIREHGSSGGVVYHNNTDGTCGFCNSQLETLLPKDAVLWVFPPQDAVAKDPWARQGPTEYEGNAAVPEPPAPNPQPDLFNGQQP